MHAYNGSHSIPLVSSNEATIYPTDEESKFAAFIKSLATAVETAQCKTVATAFVKTVSPSESTTNQPADTEALTPTKRAA